MATRHKAILGFLLPVLLGAAALRAVHLDESLWYDELFSTGMKLEGWPRLAATLVEDVHPPAHHLIMAAWNAAVGDGTVLVRLPSLFAGLAVLLLIFALGREAFGPGTAALATLLGALSPVLIEYSVEARPYALMTAVVLAQALVFTKAGRAPHRRGPRLLWAALACGGALVHHYAAVGTVVQVLLALLGGRGPRLSWLLLAALAAVPPAAWILLRTSLAPLPTDLAHLGVFDARAAFALYGDWMAGGDVLRPLAAEGRLLAALAGLVAVLGVLLPALGALAALLRPETRRAGLLVVAMATALPAGLFVAGWLGRTGYYVPRSALWCLPFAILLVAHAVESAPARLRGPARVLVLALAVAATLAWALDGRVWRQPDWRGAATDLAADFAPERAPRALVVSAFRPQPLEFYDDRIGAISDFGREEQRAASLRRRAEGRLPEVFGLRAAFEGRLEAGMAALRAETRRLNLRRRLVPLRLEGRTVEAALAARPDLDQEVFSVVADEASVAEWERRAAARDWTEERRGRRRGLVTLRYRR